MVNWLLPVRIVQAIFAIIALGISAKLVSVFDDLDAEDSYTSRAGFNVFASLFTLLTLLYSIPILFFFRDSAFAHPFFTIVLDGLNWIFWVAAFACIADRLDILEEYNQTDSLSAALVAFGVMLWLTFTVTLVFAIIGFFRGRSGKGGAAAPPPQGV